MNNLTNRLKQIEKELHEIKAQTIELGTSINSAYMELSDACDLIHVCATYHKKQLAEAL